MAIALAVTAVLQPLFTEYNMVTLPGNIPETNPVLLPIIATPVFKLLHTPPAMVSVSDEGAEIQIEVGPVMIPAVGNAVIVSTLVVFIDPQMLLTV
jgi:hypothetical protein